MTGAWLGRRSAGVLLLHGSVCFSPLTGKAEHTLDSGVFIQSQNLMGNFQTNKAVKLLLTTGLHVQHLCPKEFIPLLFNEEFVWFHCVSCNLSLLAAYMKFPGLLVLLFVLMGTEHIFFSESP